MKKLFLIAAAITGTICCNAAHVSEQIATTVAKNFLGKYYQSGQNIFLAKKVTLGNTNIITMYIFNTVNNDGFVIVSADDAVQPILGYSTENSFVKSGKSQSPEVDYWLKGYSSQIASVIISKKNAPPATAEKWQRLINNTFDNTGTANRPTLVEPLLATTWDQMPYYNDLCPIPGGAGGATPTGCVATAMAQIMKYWENPTTGTGNRTYNSSTIGGSLSADFENTTYDWSNMPNYLESSSSPEEVTAVATLMYHCGVSVKMDYNTAQSGGSGAMVINDDVGGGNFAACAENALKNNFGYKNTIVGYSRGYFSDSAWHNMLKFELDNGRPLLYTGFEGFGGGHAFVFDGYDENEMFHVNWGWSGMSDGYFTDANLNPDALGTGGGNGNFNYMQEALVMIEPVSSVLPPNPFTPDISDPSYVYEYQEPTTTTQEIEYGDAYSMTEYLKYSGGGVANNTFIIPVAVDTLTYKSWNPTAIALNNGFEHSFGADEVYDYHLNLSNTNMLPVGAYFIVFLYSNNATLQQLVTQQNGDPYAPLLVVKNEVSSIHTLYENDNITIFPNPADNYVSVDFSNLGEKINSYSICDVTGKVLTSQEYITSSNRSFIINTQFLSTGNYILKLGTENNFIIKKISIIK